MNEIKNYDKAANRFYSSQNIIGLPMVSWDFFGVYFDALCKDYNDATALKNLALENKWSYTADFEEGIIKKEQVVVVTDPDLRIVYATNNILGMSGYYPKEIIGETPKMFQGEATCKETRLHISNAIRAQKPFEATILNYRKNGSTYKCWIKAEPVYNEQGKVVNFIAYEREVA